MLQELPIDALPNAFLAVLIVQSLFLQRRHRPSNCIYACIYVGAAALHILILTAYIILKLLPPVKSGQFYLAVDSSLKKCAIIKKLYILAIIPASLSQRGVQTTKIRKSGVNPILQPGYKNIAPAQGTVSKPDPIRWDGYSSIDSPNLPAQTPGLNTKLVTPVAIHVDNTGDLNFGLRQAKSSKYELPMDGVSTKDAPPTPPPPPVSRFSWDEQDEQDKSQWKFRTNFQSGRSVMA
ncbi:hypothetical protein LOZ65_006625 [Ophidiomyces ophidiicola]|nr:hypothetical protein LOZ65_006625 [Ophidiomyces ophidiicola]